MAVATEKVEAADGQQFRGAGQIDLDLLLERSGSPSIHNKPTNIVYLHQADAPWTEEEKLFLGVPSKSHPFVRALDNLYGKISSCRNFQKLKPSV